MRLQDKKRDLGVAASRVAVAHPAAVAGLTLMALLLSGCSAYYPLYITDSSATHVSARAVLRLTETPRGGIEVDYGRVSGSDVQRLSDFQTAELGGVTLRAPVTLDNSARLQHAHVVYNHLLFANRPVEMEWFAGAAGLRLDWHSVPRAEAGQPLQAAVRHRMDTWGPTAGLVGRWRPHPMFALEARGSVMLTLVGSPSYSADRGASEFAFVFSPIPALRLRVGYAESSTSVDGGNPSVASDVSFKTRGPLVGLALEFR